MKFVLEKKQKAFNLSEQQFKPAVSCIFATEDSRPDPAALENSRKPIEFEWKFLNNQGLGVKYSFKSLLCCPRAQ